jgi:hypothetical protein
MCKKLKHTDLNKSSVQILSLFQTFGLFDGYEERMGSLLTKEGKVVPVLNYEGGSGCTDPYFLDLSTSWR